MAPINELREAWKNRIEAGDYEQHMAAIGQAEANAGLLREFLQGLPEGSRVLVAGAGPGQFFEYFPASEWGAWQVTFSDVNQAYLRRLRERAAGAVCVCDDIERSALRGVFEAVTATLVLEHVDWRKGAATLCGYGARRVLIVMQQNPERMETAVTPGRRLPGTLEEVRQLDPGLLDEAELTGFFAERGYELRERRPRPVADGKTMLGLVYERAGLRG